MHDQRTLCGGSVLCFWWRCYWLWGCYRWRAGRGVTYVAVVEDSCSVPVVLLQLLFQSY
ncbi:hypothetical protein Hanom_Chr06g00504071 [Helianthus anomalus]